MTEFGIYEMASSVGCRSAMDPTLTL